MIHKSDLKSVIAHDNASDEALFLGETLFVSGNIREAKQILDEYIVKNERNEKNYRCFSYALDLMGQCHFANKDFALAKACYLRATGINPDCEFAHHNLGILYTRLSDEYLIDDFEKGCEWFYLAQVSLNESLQLNGKNPYFLNSKAIWHQKYVKILEKLPGDPEELFLTITKNYQLAINSYLKSQKNSAEICEDFKRLVHSNLIECFMQLGHHLFHKGCNNFQAAQKMYHSVLKLQPKHLEAIYQMGVTFCNQKNHVKAREYFSCIFRVTMDKNEHAQAWFQIAITYRLDKNWEEAKNAIHSALKLAPNNTYFREEKTTLFKAIPRTHQCLFNTAKPVLREECSESEEGVFMLSGSH